MTWLVPEPYKLGIARGRDSNQSLLHKFGANEDIDTGTTPEDVWGNGGLYTGHDATAGEDIGVRSTGLGSVNDTGSLVSSGTSTGGSATTLVNTGATFVTDGVAVGDVILNDTDNFYGFVTVVTSETTLTVLKFEDGDAENSYAFETGKAYRVVNANGTGAAVIEFSKALESDYAVYISEFIIMNAGTEVFSSGTDYLRNSRARVIHAGSSGSALGDIIGRQRTTTANIFWSIRVGFNQTLVAADTIPAGKTLYLTECWVSMARSTGAAGTADCSLLIRRKGSVYQNKIHTHVTDAKDYQNEDGWVEPVPEYADIKWNIDNVSDNNTTVSADWSGYLVTNGS